MKNLNKLIYWSYASLFFFIPLIFVPCSYELFEFNKIVLVYFFTIIILWSWLTKIILQKKLIFHHTFWDIPLILFLFSQIISTIFSIDPHTSIFGYYSRFNGGLLSTLCYLTLYWAAVNNLNKQKAKKIITFALAGGVLVAVYGIAQHFGIDKDYWVQDVQRRVFSTLGQPNWLAAYLNILIFLTIRHPECSEGSPQHKKSKGFLHSLKTPQNDAILYLLFSIFYTTLLFTKSRSGFLGFVIPFSIWLIHNLKTGRDLCLKNKKLKNTGLTVLITIILSISIGIPFSVKDKLNVSFLSDVPNSQPATRNSQSGLNITPSSNIRRIVWQGGINLWKQNPIVGTGIETFGYSYYWVRPNEHNTTSEWNFIYNKAHNELINFAATTGTLGIATYLVLIITALIFSLKNCLYSIFYILISISITNFFGFSVVTTSLFFFLLPGIVWIAEGKKHPPKNLQGLEFPTLKVNRIVKTILTGSTTIIFLILISFIVCYWLADFHYAKGEKYAKSGLLNSGIEHLNRAIRLNPLEPNFYSERGVTYAKLAGYFAQENEIEEAEKYIKPAENDLQTALNISPYHINFYKSKARIYYYLALYDLNLLEKGIKTLEKAEKLAPTDPKIPFNIAQIYQTLDENNKAKKYYQKTLELKPNYLEAKERLEEL